MNIDTLSKFMFESAAVRGELVELSNTWQQICARRSYPKAVQAMLGELLAAAALLTANLKFNGTMILQLHGDGPVRLLVAECNNQLQMRATAKLAPEAEITDDASLQSLVNQHGRGRFIITLDPNNKLPGQTTYQGVVPLDGDDIASVLENYMLRSEQLDTKLCLAANGSVVRGLLLQKLPRDGGSGAQETELDTWQRAVMLANTLHRPELLETEIAELMHRLFWDETLRVFDPKHPCFACSCSREKVGNMLKMLGQAEIDDALNEMETLGIDCDFCGLHYQFDRVDCAQLFANDAPMEAMMVASDVKH